VTWLRIDDRMPDHPKIVGLPPGTKWALVELWCYSAAHRTDGVVTFGAAKRLASAGALKQLEVAGLLERNGQAFHIHDWLDHNISAADAEAKRAAENERLKRWRENRKRNGDGNGGETDV
jgi:hypothetical protein